MTIKGAESVLKRELRLGSYAKLRERKPTFDEVWLRDKYAHWLAPMPQEHGGPDRVPEAVRFCANFDGAATLLVSEVNKIIEQEKWHELALILREVEMWSAVMINSGAERPWWVLQAVRTSQTDVAESVDVSREAAVPIDVDAAARPKKKRKQLPKPSAQKPTKPAVQAPKPAQQQRPVSKKKRPVPEPVRSWPTDASIYNEHDPEGQKKYVGSRRDAVRLISDGGSWRSYAILETSVEGDGAGQDSVQLLSCEDGKIAMRRVGGVRGFCIAECSLRLVKDYFVSGEGEVFEGVIDDLSFFFVARKVLPGLAFECDGVPYTTQVDDLELFYYPTDSNRFSEGPSGSLLLRKETALAKSAREAKEAAAKREMKNKLAEEEAVRQAARERRAAIKAGTIKIKKRKRKADKW